MELTSDLYIDQSKDWYYVQAQSNGSPKWQYIVVFAKTKKEAEAKISEWLYEIDAKDHFLYRNNYKPDARRLVREGKVIK